MTMPLPSREDRKKEAFRLFEDGRYQESLQLCTLVLDEEKDPAVEVLAATNLYTTGRLEDAEVFFRDLVLRMPGSSYVHSYLAKVLEARGDDGAIAEYATAVHLDPTNQDALRSYAEYLLSRQDFRSALPVFRLLARFTRKPGDIRHLMRALIETGRADEAISAHALHGSDTGKTPEYVDALARTGNHQAAADVAHRIWGETQDPVMLRKYLDALSRYDLPVSLAAYETQLQGDPDSMILSDYALLLNANGENQRALEVAGTLVSRDPSPMHRLLVCDLLASGNKIPGFLKIADRAYKIACTNLRKVYFNGKKDIKISAALLYAGGKRAVFVSGPKSPVTGRYTLHYILENNWNK